MRLDGLTVTLYPMWGTRPSWKHFSPLLRPFFLRFACAARRDSPWHIAPRAALVLRLSTRSLFCACPCHCRSWWRSQGGRQTRASALDPVKTGRDDQPSTQEGGLGGHSVRFPAVCRRFRTVFRPEALECVVGICRHHPGNIDWCYRREKASHIRSDILDACARPDQ
ncbi:hypothetical protein M440DRAFT_228954 [Trichoderma longibrachiatum ATCC 18648]|uniref:Uncharacterized protein n=1 Tax=Trichoderma longibrachiatum ATCC 18648 TaxID=983965 RepID=A0A2T4CC21_TRILO|nr:hypothetical protein M440DRAFT_228954 [Trichoderma longibrachiatum ATCC 18648]